MSAKSVCNHCKKPIEPVKGAILYPFTIDDTDARYYCGWACLIGKLDETLVASRKLIELIKNSAH